MSGEIADAMYVLSVAKSLFPGLRGYAVEFPLMKVGQLREELEMLERADPSDRTAMRKALIGGFDRLGVVIRGGYLDRA